jgi:hypothetical protein
MDAQSQIFFTGRYTYRKPHVLVAGILSLSIGAFVLRYLVLASPKTVWSIKAFGAMALVGGIGGVLAVCGLLFLKLWFARTSMLLEISTTGIRYGNVFHSWDAIHWLSGHSERKRVWLFYQTMGRGLAGFDRALPVDQNPTAEEYANLMITLRNAISAKHPNVIFG